MGTKAYEPSAHKSTLIQQVFCDYADQPLWVEWRPERGKKPPLIAGTDQYAKVDDPSTWRPLADCRGARLGIMFNGDGLGGLDLDACRDPASGDITAWARDLIEEFDSYTEVSPSGTGIRLFASDAPNRGKMTLAMNGERINGKQPQIEAVSGLGFFQTVTGNHLEGTPLTINPATPAWERLVERYEAQQRNTKRSAKMDEGRDGALFALGCHLQNEGASDADIEAQLRAANLAGNVALHPNFAEGPLSERDLKRILKSVKRYEKGRIVELISDTHLVKEFIRRHSDELRFVTKWGQWLVWDGVRWSEDEECKHFQWVGKVCIDASLSLKPNSSQWRAVLSTRAKDAVLNAARREQGIVGREDQWDVDLWMLNTPGGVVELSVQAERPGSLRPARPEDHLTKLCAVTPDWNCPTPLWNLFLHKVMDDDAELIAYLKRSCGYWLTGSVREQTLQFQYGSGRNGKSVYKETVSGVLGDYSVVMPMDALMATRADRHPTEIARLRGARLAVATESTENRSWDEAKIKNLTGGDRLTGRFMRQDFFDFDPTHKLVVVSNNQPGLRNVDEAIRRRIQMVPFRVVISPEERDTQLGDKLKSEWPGILAWMIDGCLEWQRDGLNPPSAVLKATQEYLEAQDTFGEWLADRCELGKKFSAKSSELFDNWKGWMEDRGDRNVGRPATLRERLEKRGFEYERTNAARLFHGLRLGKSPTDQPTDPNDPTKLPHEILDEEGRPGF